MSRTWLMFGAKSEAATTENGAVLYKHIWENPRALAMSGVPSDKILQLELQENPEGEYMGWIPEDRPESLNMVQLKKIFAVQFPYGVKAAMEAGQGEAVPLSIVEKVPA